MNFVRCIPLLLFLLSGAFIFILGLILVSERNGNISYLQGIQSFEKNSFKIAQSSQQKEQTITQTFLVKNIIKDPNTTSPPTPPKKNDTQSGTNKETKTTPEDSAKLLQDFTKKLDARYLWGTYKPHLLHAITQRLPKPLTFGMIYLATESNTRTAFSYRDVKNSGWKADSLYHDGKQFSESSFENKQAYLKLKNYFYKEKFNDQRQRWHSVTTKELSGIGNLNNKASLIYYFSIEDFDGLEDSRYLQYDAAQGIIKVMRSQGQDPLAHYKIVVFDNEKNPVAFSDVQKFVYIDNTTPKRETWKVESIVETKMNVDPTLKLNFKTLPDNSELRHQSTTTNLIAVQLIFDQYGTFTVHIVYDDSAGADLTDIENHHRAETITKYSSSLFLPEFTNIFTREGVSLPHQTCGISAFSNLLSGIGYYYGKISVKGQHHLPQPNLPLYTGSPSKTEFPRGFLWDEGFHSLIYCKWNAEICIDVLRHWLNTQLDNGWIPREQLRGDECINNGNPDYVDQIRDEANPPTLIFMVLALMEYKERDELPKGASELLEQLYPKLKRWFEWFYTTQVSEKSLDLFAWRSNHANEGLVLGSGLDDYPRGIDYSRKPLAHLDLQVWMTFMAENMVKIAEFIGKKDDTKELQKMHMGIKANLNKFLDQDDHIYKDLVSTRDGRQEFANHFGYVNLFPLFFGYIEKDSPELDKLLDHMHSTVKIWSSYGLLSLARDDNKYMRTRDAYWGGPIWIPINYLALRGLKLYYSDNQKAREIYNKLRDNIIRNVCAVKDKTGFFYEQYNQDNGNGQKNYPFTGWTAAVLPIIYEKY